MKNIIVSVMSLKFANCLLFQNKKTCHYMQQTGKIQLVFPIENSQFYINLLGSPGVNPTFSP